MIISSTFNGEITIDRETINTSKEPYKTATFLVSNSIIIIKLKQDNFTRNYLVLQKWTKKTSFFTKAAKSGQQKYQLKFEVNHDHLIFV